jgi:hypothetical protein
VPDNPSNNDLTIAVSSAEFSDCLPRASIPVLRFAASKAGKAVKRTHQMGISPVSPASSVTPTTQTQAVAPTTKKAAAHAGASVQASNAGSDSDGDNDGSGAGSQLNVVA